MLMDRYRINRLRSTTYIPFESNRRASGLASQSRLKSAISYR
jgi:hypothetical protein